MHPQKPDRAPKPSQFSIMSWTAPALLTALSILPSMASADSECQVAKASARARVSRLSAIFREDGRCADLRGTESLSQLREAKAEWLKNFEAENPYTLKAALLEVRFEARSLRDLPSGMADNHPEFNGKLWKAIRGIDELGKMADHMRSDRGTNLANAAEVERAFNLLQLGCAADVPFCPINGQGALDELAAAVEQHPARKTDPALARLAERLRAVDLRPARRELDGLRAILDCRNNEISLQIARREAARECLMGEAVAPGACSGESCQITTDRRTPNPQRLSHGGSDAKRDAAAGRAD